MTETPDELSLSRRQFSRGFASIGAMSFAGSGGIATVQQVAIPEDLENTATTRGFAAAPILFGGLDDRPDEDDGFWENKTGVYVYKTDGSAGGGGALSWLAVEDGEVIEDWTEFPTHLRGYPTAELPSSPANGTLLFDENRNLPTWFDTDHWEYPNFVDDVKTSPTTVANTTTRTTVFDPDINEDSLVKGRKYQIQLSGSFGTANTSDSFTVDVNLAGATDLAGIGNAPANVSAKPWWVQFEFSVRESGTNGVLAPTTFGMFAGSAQQAETAHATVSVDTTTVTELSVDIEWDAADPDNTVTVDQAHLIQMA